MTDQILVPEVVGVELASFAIEQGISSLAVTALGFLANQKPATAKIYAGHLKSFFEFTRRLDPEFLSIGQLSRNHIIFYRQSLEQEGRSNNAVLTALSAISSFSKFLAEAGKINQDVCYGVKRPKSVNSKETGDFSAEDVRAIFLSFDPESFYFHSHRAIFAVAFFTGLRQASIRHLKIKNYGEIAGHRVLKLRIKGDKPHEIPLNPIVVRYLEEHLQKLRELGFQLHGEHYLFPPLKIKHDKAMCASAFRGIFLRRIKRSGITLSDLLRYCPHSTRATFATILLNDHEVPAEQVQALMGHSSTDTTLRYDKRTKSHDASPVYSLSFKIV